MFGSYRVENMGMQASLCMGLTVILTCCPSEETLTMRAGALAFPQY